MARLAAKAKATASALPGVEFVARNLDVRANARPTITRTRITTMFRATVTETVTLTPRSENSHSAEEAETDQYQAIVTLGSDGWPGVVMDPFESDDSEASPVTPVEEARVAEVEATRVAGLSEATTTTGATSITSESSPAEMTAATSATSEPSPSGTSAEDAVEIPSMPALRKLEANPNGSSMAPTDEPNETPTTAEIPESTVTEVPGPSTAKTAATETTEIVSAPTETTVPTDHGASGGNNATSPLPAGGMSPCEISVYTYDAASNCASIFNTAGACGLSTYFPEAKAIPLPRLAVPEAIWKQHGASQHNTLCGKTVTIKAANGVTGQAVIADQNVGTSFDLCMDLWEQFGYDSGGGRFQAEYTFG